MTFSERQHAKVVLLVAFLLLTALADAQELRGTVVDAEGHAVDGASLWLCHPGDILTAVSDAQGQFVFEKAPIAEAQIVARKEGLAYGGRAVRIVGAGSIELVMPTAAPSPIRVIDSAFQPIAGARVTEIVVDGRFSIPVDRLQEHGFPALRSDGEGKLSLGQLPEGGHVAFTIDHPEYVEKGVAYLDAGEPLSVALVPGIPVRGRVINTGGEGVGGAQVSVFRQDAEGKSIQTRTMTGPEGYFRVQIVDAQHFATARHPDHPLAAPLLVDPAADNALVITLPDPHWLEGRVVRPEDKPLGGIAVRYTRDDTVYAQGITDSQGRYTLCVEAGEGLIHAEPPLGYMAASPLGTKVLVKEADRIEIPPIMLEPVPEVRGRIIGPDGQPAPRVLISTRDYEPPHWAITDEFGQFAFRIERRPAQDNVSLVAEHAQLMLRAGFEFDLADQAEPQAQLGDFEPNTRVDSGGAPAPNDLESLRGKAAPEWQCDAWFNGGPVALKDLKGKVVVLTLWGAFDMQGADRDRIAQLRALHALFQDAEDLAFVLVHDSSLEADVLEQYIEVFEIPFRTGLDAAPCVTFARYNTSVIPQTVLIDKTGILRYDNVEGRLLELIKILRDETL